MALFQIAAIIPAICLAFLVGWFCITQFNDNSNNDNNNNNNRVMKHDESSLSSSSPVENQREFDYFLLALQWPPTYCRNTHKCCSKNACCRGSNSPSVFTIHGLWTDYNDGTWPSCCNGPEFDVKEISTLFDALNKYWPTLSCSSSSTCHGGKGLFWAHEWEKHGTCSFPVFQDEYNYFLSTINLYFKYNVTEVLTEAGYVPSNSEKYPLGGISTAIKNAFHATPEITCSGGAIEEVRLCFYKDFKPRDCDATSSLDSSCPEYVSLPAFVSIGLHNNGTMARLDTAKSSV